MNVFVHSINNELQNMLQLLAGCLSAITDRIRAVAPSATFAVVGSAGKGMNLPLPHSDLDILATLTSDELAQFEDNERELVLPLRTNARGMQVLQMPAFPLPNGDATIKVDLVPVSDKSSGSLLDVVAVRRRPDYHRTRAMVLYLKAFLRVKSSMVDPLLSSPGVGGMSSYLLQVLVIAYVDSVPDTCANGDLRFCIVGFFGYYGKYFDFANYCIDVTSSDNRFPPKSTFTGPHFTFSSVCAVDPHDPTNNLGEMTYRISLIRKVFGAAYDDLTLNDVTLLSLFPAPVTLSGNPLF
ncbi:hypothetical protein PBRA_008754 [Plasmodiophora brassicae]|nr:hypothetical protein PBRA_008754 [Plasmodiophora brassicae]